MKQRWLLAAVFLSLFPASLPAQEAHSLGIGGAATAAPMGIFGIYWNPAELSLPDGTTWSAASGFSAFDTSNTGNPVIHFDPNSALGSSTDPIQRFQQYQGLFAVKYINMAGGVVYNQQLNYLASQGAVQFFKDRSNNALSASPYALNYLQTTQQVANLVLSYAMPMPIGSFPYFSIGGSLKYHDGLYYQQNSLTGTYTQGSATGYTYTKTTSNSGIGLSMDLGLFLKLTDTIQAGMMFQNIQSNFNWQATQQNYQLNPSTGAETPVGTSSSVTIASPLPYATKLGVAMTPPEKNITLEGEVSWSQQQTRWRFGTERYYPEANLVVRLGTFADEVSNQQLWSFGVGYIGRNVMVDLSFLTRSLPNLQNSLALGGALDVVVSF